MMKRRVATTNYAPRVTKEKKKKLPTLANVQELLSYEICKLGKWITLSSEAYVQIILPDYKLVRLLRT